MRLTQGKLKLRKKENHFIKVIERLAILGPAAWFSAATKKENYKNIYRETSIESYDFGGKFTVKFNGYMPEPILYDIKDKIDVYAGNSFFKRFGARGNRQQIELSLDPDKIPDFASGDSGFSLYADGYKTLKSNIFSDTYTVYSYTKSTEHISYNEIEKNLTIAEDTAHVYLIESDIIERTDPDHAIRFENISYSDTVVAEVNYYQYDGPALEISGLENYNGGGTITFFYVIVYNDPGAFKINKVTLDVNFTPVNDAPIVSGDVDLGSSAEDTSVAVTAAQLLANASDVDTGDTLSVTNLTVSSGSLEVTETGWIYTPATDASGEVTFSYDVSDGTTSTAATATLAVTAANDAPIVSGDVDLGSSAEDTSVAVTAAQLLANASDVDTGDTLSVTNLTVSSGSLEVTETGWIYTPATDASGEVTFSYDVSDGTTSTATNATLTVTAANDAPTGSVAILGKARVGEILYFETSDINDIDGMTEGAISWDLTDNVTDNQLVDESLVDSAISATFSFTDGGGTLEELTDTTTSVQSQSFYDLRIIDRPSEYEYRVGLFVTIQNTQAFDEILGDYSFQLNFNSTLVSIDPNSVIVAGRGIPFFVEDTDPEDGIVEISVFNYNDEYSTDVALLSFDISPLEENLKEIPLELKNIVMDYVEHVDFEDILVPQVTGSILGVDPGDILLPPPEV